MRRIPLQPPTNSPYFVTACTKYSLHDGWNRHVLPSNGLISFWYPRTRMIAALPGHDSTRRSRVTMTLPPACGAIPGDAAVCVSALSTKPWNRRALNPLAAVAPEPYRVPAANRAVVHGTPHAATAFSDSVWRRCRAF